MSHDDPPRVPGARPPTRPTSCGSWPPVSGRSVLFTRTKHQAKKLAKQLTAAGIPAVDLHGNLSQNARERNLEAFSNGATRVLCATDIAARGIHVDDVALVVHVDPPAEHKAYLHRSGRTARAGAGGTVVTVATPDQAGEVRTARPPGRHHPRGVGDQARRPRDHRAHRSGGSLRGAGAGRGAAAPGQRRRTASPRRRLRPRLLRRGLDSAVAAAPAAPASPAVGRRPAPRAPAPSWPHGPARRRRPPSAPAPAGGAESFPAAALNRCRLPAVFTGMSLDTSRFTRARLGRGAIGLTVALAALTACGGSSSGSAAGASSSAASSTPAQSSAGAGASSAASTVGQDGTLTAKEAEFSIDLGTKTLKAGPYLVTVNNQGKPRTTSSWSRTAAGSREPTRSPPAAADRSASPEAGLLRLLLLDREPPLDGHGDHGHRPVT